METDNILNTISEADRDLLTTINFDGPSGYDFFWAMYTDKWTWIPFVLVIIYCLLRPGNWKHRLLIVGCTALLFVLSDFVVSSFIKNIICRPRPSHDPAVMNLLSYVNDYRGGAYGFPSNHASNGFAAATFLALLMRNRWVALTAFLWAIGSCYSRMYMGVHYPTDILCGALLGCVFAIIVYLTYKKAAKHLALPPESEIYVSRESLSIPIIFLATVVTLLILSWSVQ
ncbi:MAG: phosphatase PAP2 family protein [Prevotella sp.]|nr:phosphatase PAP2 family protein [Prevotella sp.]